MSIRSYMEAWYRQQTDFYPDEEEIEALRDEAERRERAALLEPSDTCTGEDPDEPAF